MKRTLERIVELLILSSLLFGFIFAVIKIVEQSTWYVN